LRHLLLPSCVELDVPEAPSEPLAHDKREAALLDLEVVLALVHALPVNVLQRTQDRRAVAHGDVCVVVVRPEGALKAFLVDVDVDRRLGRERRLEPLCSRGQRVLVELVAHDVHVVEAHPADRQPLARLALDAMQEGCHLGGAHLDDAEAPVLDLVGHRTTPFARFCRSRISRWIASSSLNTMRMRGSRDRAPVSTSPGAAGVSETPNSKHFLPSTWPVTVSIMPMPNSHVATLPGGTNSGAMVRPSSVNSYSGPSARAVSRCSISSSMTSLRSLSCSNASSTLDIAPDPVRFIAFARIELRDERNPSIRLITSIAGSVASSTEPSSRSTCSLLKPSMT